MSIQRQLVVWVLCSVFFSVSIAEASVNSEAAKRLFDEGQTFYLQKKYAKAAAKFVSAFQARPFPAFLFNIAVCYEKSGDYRQALKYYERYSVMAPKNRDSELVGHRITELKRHLSSSTGSKSSSSSGTSSQPTTPKRPTLPEIQTRLVVGFHTEPEGAEVRLGDEKSKSLGETPLDISLPKGRYTAFIRKKGFRPERKTFDVSNKRIEFMFRLGREQDLGFLDVKGNVPGAKIYLDKRSFGAIGQTPYSGHQRRGTRTLIIEKAGYRPYSKPITIVAGKTNEIRFTLERVSFGWLKVTGKTTKGATIFVDGKKVPCTGYPCHSEVGPGRHRVVVEKDGMKPYETQIDVRAAQEIQVAVRLNPKPSRVPAYVSFGIAAAVLAGGVVSGVISKQTQDELEEDQKNGRLFQSTDSRTTKGIITAAVANGAFVVGAVIAGLGLYYLFRDVGPASYGETRVNNLAVMPVFSPEMAGLHGTVRW